MALAQSQILSNSEVQTDEGKNAEVTELCTIKKENFRITLYKTYIKDLLYRVEATDGDENYHLDLGISHFNGQECKEYIRACPNLLEKLFKIGNSNISIKFGDMVCDLESNIISAKIILPRVVGTELEQMKKKISRQDVEISKLKEQISIMIENTQLIEKNLDGKIELLDNKIVKSKPKCLKKVQNMSNKIGECSERMNDALERIVKLEHKLSDSFQLQVPVLDALSDQFFGTWKWCDGTINIERQKESINILMKHQYGQDNCSVISPKWKKGKFYWKSKYQGKSCPAVSNEIMTFCYDPQKPNTMDETYSQGTNVFNKV
jgi:hypothetical protein